MEEPWGIPVLIGCKGCLWPSHTRPSCLSEKKVSVQQSDAGGKPKN